MPAKSNKTAKGASAKAEAPAVSAKAEAPVVDKTPAVRKLIVTKVVKVLRNRSINGVVVLKGEVIEIDEKTADRFVRENNGAYI